MSPRSVRAPVVLFFALSTALAACSGEDESQGSAGTAGSAGLPGGPGSGAPEAAPDFAELPTVPEADAADSLGTVCATLLACDCPNAASVTQEECQGWFDTLTSQAIDENPGLTYDGDCVASLVAAINYVQCASESQVDAWWELMTAAPALGCKMYYGTKQEGDPCTTLTDSNGDDCGKNLLCSDGRCEVRPYSIPEGDPCDGEEVCAVPAFCLPDQVGTTAGHCAPLPAPGQACYLGLLCEVGSSCVGGTCEKLPAVGHPCAESEDILKRTCDPTSSCEDGQCVALPAAGESCSSSVGCTPGYLCTQGTCTADTPALCQGGPFPLFPNTSG